jgi:hypothetical protein
MFRIIREPDCHAILANPDEIGPAIRHEPPGRYIVEEVSRAGELLPSGHSCRHWGMAHRHADDQIALDPDPWPA